MKTRFICTIGPKTLDHESLARLHSAGMNIARDNDKLADLQISRASVYPRIREARAAQRLVRERRGAC
ncbi:MAG: hypothetical protein ACKOAW_12450 [Actinomycetota bacterium]